MSSNNYITVNRRTAIKSFAGLAGITGLTGIGRAGIDTTEIATVKRDGEVLKTATVATEWYDEVKKKKSAVRSGHSRTNSSTSQVWNSSGTDSATTTSTTAHAQNS